MITLILLWFSLIIVFLVALGGFIQMVTTGFNNVFEFCVFIAMFYLVFVLIKIIFWGSFLY